MKHIVTRCYEPGQELQVRDYLVQHIDDNDQLIVIDLGGNAAWHGFNDDCSNWITSNLQA